MDIINDIIYPVLNEIKEEEDMDFVNSPSLELYGEGSTVFDSLSIVDFLVRIQDKIFDITDKNVVVASAKALSNSDSPFNTVESLKDYINSLL